MIPKKSTPIKHEILIDIFAKGLLSKNEMRVAAYIMRWSWGFDGEGRRQDWTRKLKKTKIAKDMEMNECSFISTVNKMIGENKIMIKNKCYQFNEHYDKWIKPLETKGFKKPKPLETQGKTLRNSRKNLEKLKENPLETKGSTVKNLLQDKCLPGLKDNKDNIKDNKNKLGFSFIDKKFVNLKLYINNFSERYPNTDVRFEIENMEGWLMAEYEKKKSGKKNKLPKDYNLFVHKWLRRNEVDYE